MKARRVATVVCRILVFSFGTLSANDEPKDLGKPNVVLVFMDNFGWGEPGFNGGGVIRGTPTPRMDKLRRRGSA